MVCSGYGKNGALSVLQVCVGKVGDTEYNLAGLNPHSHTISIPEEYPAPGGDNL